MTRLIDADALKAEWYRMNDIDENDRGVRFMGYTEITRWIDNAPTIEPDGDLISRQDAIDAFRKSVSKSETEDSLCYNLGLGVAEKVLESLPSAPDSRQRGEWEYHSNPALGINPEDAFCPYCKYHIDTTMVSFDDYNFCPNCGADMRKGDNNGNGI